MNININSIKKIVIFGIFIAIMQLGITKIASANVDSVYCVGSQGYMSVVTSDWNWVHQGVPAGLHYPGSPKACNAGESVTLHHFTDTCPTCTPPPVYNCTGENPPNGATWCPNDTTGLAVNTSWKKVSSCTSSRKCEYTMPPPIYSCTGENPPNGATWCPNDTTGLAVNTSWKKVSSCTSSRKCEYTMPPPIYSCTGENPPNGATWCPDDTTGLAVNTSWQKVNSCTSSRKCEYTMQSSLEQAKCGSADGTTLASKPTESEMCPTESHSARLMPNGPDCTVKYGYGAEGSCYQWYCTAPDLDWVLCTAKTTENLRWLGGCNESRNANDKCRDGGEVFALRACDISEYNDTQVDIQKKAIENCLPVFEHNIGRQCFREVRYEGTPPSNPSRVRENGCEGRFDAAMVEYNRCKSTYIGMYQANDILKEKYGENYHCDYSRNSYYGKWNEWSCLRWVDKYKGEFDYMLNCAAKNTGPTCGLSNTNTYKKTSEIATVDSNTGVITDSKDLCKVGDVAVDWFDHSGDASNGGKAWVWKCNDGSADSNQCLAYKEGKCGYDATTNPHTAPYNNTTNACKFGSFNSVKLVGETLYWKCGTGTSAKHVGDFFSNNINSGDEVATDYYGPKTGGADCQCIPTYNYSCLSTGYTGSCNNNNKKETYQAIKTDKSCFIGQSKIITPAEYNTATGGSCVSKTVNCDGSRLEGNYYETN